MWYAPDETSFEQYGITEGTDSWTHERTWPGMDGHAGVGCYSWGPGTTVSIALS
jgi:hypothetical protein